MPLAWQGLAQMSLKTIEGHSVEANDRLGNPNTVYLMHLISYSHISQISTVDAQTPFKNLT